MRLLFKKKNENGLIGATKLNFTQKFTQHKRLSLDRKTYLFTLNFMSKKKKYTFRKYNDHIIITQITRLFYNRIHYISDKIPARLL